MVKIHLHINLSRSPLLVDPGCVRCVFTRDST